MLRGLGTSFSIFTVLINIDISSIAVQSHTAKLHCSPVDSVVSWHDNCFLLFHHTALGTGSANTLLECAGGVGRCRSCGCCGSSIVSIKGAANGASCGGCGSRGRDIGNLRKIRLGQIILGSCNFSRRGRDSRFFEGLRDSRFRCLFHGNRNWRWNRDGCRFRGLLLFWLFLLLLFLLLGH